MHFGVSKSFDIGEEKLDEEKVREGFYQSLKSFFPESKISDSKFSGSLKNLLEHGVIKADINLSLKNQKLFIEMKGNTKMSTGLFFFLSITIICLILGYMGFAIGVAINCMFLLITFLLSRNIPQRYIEETIDSFRLRLEQYPEEFMPDPVQPSNEKAKSKSLQLSSLVVAGAPTASEIYKSNNEVPASQALEDASYRKTCKDTSVPSVCEDKAAIPEVSVNSDNTNTNQSLWNPQAVVNWSLLFSPILGAWLHSKNWEELNEPEEAKKSIWWVYIGIVFIVVVLFLPDNVGPMPGVIFIIAWYFISGKKQVEYIKEKEIKYQKKPWGKPLLMGFVGLILLICVGAFVGE